jgi:hypothetical protein
MNTSVSMVHASPAAWLSPVYTPPNSTVQLLHQFCNVAGTYVSVAAVCVNTAFSGYVAVEYSTPAAVGYVVSNRRGWLALPIVARVKRADPARREILQSVEKMGAAEVILVSASPGGLSLEDRKKASGA